MSKKTWTKGDVAWLASAYGAPKKVTLASGGAVGPRVKSSYGSSRQVEARDLFETEAEAVKASARMMVEWLRGEQRRRQRQIEQCEQLIESLRRSIEAAKPEVEAAIARARELGVEVTP